MTKWTEWRQRLQRRWPALAERARADWPSWALLGGVLAIVLKLVIGKPGMIEGTYIMLALVTAGFIVLRRDLLSAWAITALFLIYDVYHLVWQPMIFPLTFLMLVGLLSARTVERRIYDAPHAGHPWQRMPGLWLWGLFLAGAIPAVWHVPIVDRVNAEVYYINVLVMPACMWALGVQVVRNVARLRRLLVLTSAFGTFVAIHAIIQATTGVFLFQTTENAAILASVNDWILEGTARTIRASSFVINPDSAGAYLAFMFFLPLGLALHSTSWRWRAVYFVESALILVALLFTYTAAAWVACAAGIVVFLVLAAHGRTRLYIFGGIAIAAVALAVVFPAEVRKLLAHATGPNELSLRIGVWETALRVLRAHPLTGIGFEIGTSYAQIAEPYRVPLQVIPVSHPHNIFLEIAVFAGIPVALIFVGLLVRMLWPVARNYARGDWRQRTLFAGLLAAFAATLVDGMADRTWTLPALTVILWLVVGAASSPALREAMVADRLLPAEMPAAQPVPMLLVGIGSATGDAGASASAASAEAEDA